MSSIVTFGIATLAHMSKPITPIPDFCKYTISDRNHHIVGLSNGSQWRVSYLFSSVSQIVIIPEDKNYRLLAVNSYGEVITSMYASLFMSPHQDSPKIIALTDGSILTSHPGNLSLKVPAESQQEITRWSLGDTVMLGFQRSPEDPAYDPKQLILINCTLDTHIPVTIS